MLHRLEMFNDVVEVLLEQGDVLRALQYASRHENMTVKYERYIEVAKSLGNPAIIEAVRIYLEQQGLSNVGDCPPAPAPPAPPPPPEP